MAVLKTSFKFPEINMGFVISARGARHLTPKKSLGRGAFDQRKGPHGGEFDPKNKKCQMPGGQPGGDMGTFGFDSYIMPDRKNWFWPDRRARTLFPPQLSKFPRFGRPEREN